MRVRRCLRIAQNFGLNEMPPVYRFCGHQRNTVGHAQQQLLGIGNISEACSS